MRNRLETYRPVPTGQHRAPGSALTDQQQIVGSIVLAFVPLAVVLLLANLVSLLT